MTCPLPLAMDTVSTCWGASRGQERNCCCSTTQGKVRKNSKATFYLQVRPLPCFILVVWKTVSYFLSLLDSWSELLPTLTRADADLPALYFLGATDRLLVIGGNNQENVVTSFCLQSQRWGQVWAKTLKLFWCKKTHNTSSSHLEIALLHESEAQRCFENECVIYLPRFVCSFLGAQGWENGICRTGDNSRWSDPDAEYRAQHCCKAGSPHSLPQSSSPSTHLYLLWSRLLSSLLKSNLLL